MREVDKHMSCELAILEWEMIRQALQTMHDRSPECYMADYLQWKSHFGNGEV